MIKIYRELEAYLDAALGTSLYFKAWWIGF